MTEAADPGDPRTVVAWHRAGFRVYWKYLSRTRRVVGRRPVNRDVRELIFRMAAENPTWGAPRIHGELLKLGFHVSEPTVSRWLQRMPRSPDLGKRWLTFLRNHREGIAAMDFFTVPTLTFGVLHCFFIIDHGRRRILRFNVTRNPSSLWIVQQMREAMHCSLMLRTGARPEITRDNMGHANIDMTQNVYGRSWWEERVEAVTRTVDAVFCQLEPQLESPDSVAVPSN